MYVCAVQRLKGRVIRGVLQIATVLFYLTDVMEGGETIFPLESAGGLARLETINYRNCDRGFKVCPPQCCILRDMRYELVAFYRMLDHFRI